MASEEKTYCGKTEKEIRQAYFKKQLPKLLDSVQESGEYSEEEILALGGFLETLRGSEQSFIEKVGNSFKGTLLERNLTPPTTEQLYSQMAQEDFLKWEENVENAKNTINQVRASVAQAIKGGKPLQRDKYADYAIILETLKRWLAQDYIFREQLYTKRICDIIDDFGTSRAEAQNRAEITKEYSDYKNALKEYESVGELVLLYKKKAGLE